MGQRALILSTCATLLYGLNPILSNTLCLSNLLSKPMNNRAKQVQTTIAEFPATGKSFGVIVAVSINSSPLTYISFDASRLNMPTSVHLAKSRGQTPLLTEKSRGHGCLFSG